MPRLPQSESETGGCATLDISPTTQRNALAILRMLRPHTAIGHRKVRIGRVHDGGYVMVDDLANVSAAYSLGIDGEVSWDRQIADMNIDVYQYDHTIAGPPEQHPKFHWWKVGIGVEKSADGQLDSLENLLHANGHTNRNDLILKCDIEGFEYDMLSTISPDVLNRFRQIVIEMHFFEQIPNVEFANKMILAILNLTRDHAVVHVHANNHVGYAVNGGIAIPAVMEFTLVRRTDYELKPSTEIFPTHLDAPCAAGRIDYQLGNFVF